LFVTDIGRLDFSPGYDGGLVYQVFPDGTRKVYTSGYARPNSIAFDSAGNLYVGDYIRSTIYKVTPDGTKTPFATLSGNTVAVDAAGLVFATGFHFSQPETDVWKYTRDGLPLSFASGLHSATDLIFDPSGNLWVRDNFFMETGPMTGIWDARIYKFNPAGEKTLFVSGQRGGIGLAVNATGEVFLNQYVEISKFTPSGERSTFALAPNTSGLAIDDSGNLYTTLHETDSNTHQDVGSVYKFAPDGTRTTFVSGLSYPDFVAFPPRPALRAELTENEIVLTWPTLRSNYSVQSTTDLPAAKWESLPTQSPGLVRVPRSSSTSFFRLGSE
jgi:sugar lactone lactonase YvrE